VVFAEVMLQKSPFVILNAVSFDVSFGGGG